MTSPSRDAVWKRIMDVQEQYNQLEMEFAAIPADRTSWWLRYSFKKSLDSMVRVRGAHSHGGDVSESERRLPKLERAAKVYALKLAHLRKTVGGGVDA